MLFIPLPKQSLLLVAVKKAPIANLNVFVINSLLTKDCEAFSRVSVPNVHTHNGSFQNTPFQFYAFSLAFSNSSVLTATKQCERKAKTDKFCSIFI